MKEHIHNHEWYEEKIGMSEWRCRCGDVIFQYEDATCGR